MILITPRITTLKEISRPPMLHRMTSSERRKAPLLPRLALLGLAGASLISLLGAEIAALSILTHFQLYFCAAWAVFLLALRMAPQLRGAFWRPNRVITLGAMFFLGHVLFVASLWLPASHPDLEKPDEVDIVWFNMMFKDKALRTLEGRIQNDPPDLLCLGEIGPKTQVQLEGYPFQFRSPKHDLLIVSKYPLEHGNLVTVPGAGREQLVARVAVGRRRFRIIAVHFRQPVYPSHFVEVKQAKVLAMEETEAILVGDLNTTAWAAQFRQLCRDTGMQHGRQGRGIMDTWALGSGRWAPLPIDHMLYRGAIDLAEFEVMEWTESDHKPIRGKFLIGGKRGRKLPSDNLGVEAVGHGNLEDSGEGT